MKYSQQIKPISYIKTHASEVVRNLEKNGDPLVITQNGEAKAVLQDVTSYEKTQEALALLKILALGTNQIEEKKTVKAGEAFDRLRKLTKK